MPYSTDNQLVKNILQVEHQLKDMNPHCQVEVTVFSESLGELSDAYRVMKNLMGIHMISWPFPLKEEGRYYFEYPLPKRTNVLVRVSTK